MSSNLYQIGDLVTESLPKRSLIVGHDPKLSGLGQALRNAGLNVLEVSEYSEGISFLTQCLPPVVIISEDVPELSHPATLATLKGSFELPVLVLGSGEEISLVAAIQRGADGYLDRRAGSREQLARTRAVLRRLGLPRTSQNS